MKEYRYGVEGRAEGQRRPTFKRQREKGEPEKGLKHECQELEGSDDAVMDGRCSIHSAEVAGAAHELKGRMSESPHLEGRGRGPKLGQLLSFEVKVKGERLPNPESLTAHRGSTVGLARKPKCPWVPLFEITSLQTGVSNTPLPAPFFHSARRRGLPVCTFFLRCLILTQKIADFNSFARWLRKEQLTVSAKCLCQSPKQPIPINIRSRIDLTCKGESMG